MRKAIPITNIGFQRLMALEPFVLDKDMITPDLLAKIKDTVEYSMFQNKDQDIREVKLRTFLSMVAEQHVATWMEGSCADGIEDINDPFTFGYDVLSHNKYNGLRIEVKATQSQNWISVHTGYHGSYPGSTGLHIGPAMEIGVADLLFICRVKHNHEGKWVFTPDLACDVGALTPSTGLVRKSNGQGWYLAKKGMQVKYDGALHFY